MATARAYKTKTRIFKNAGYFVLTKRLADGTVSTNPEDIYTSDTAIVQSVTTRYSTSSEKMEDGNSFFPAAEHVTGVDAAAEIVLNTFDPKLWEFMAGATTKTAEGYYRDTADQYIIPDDGIVKLNASALKPESLVLARKTDGSDFEMLTASGEEGAGAPTAGQFTVDYETATLTFATEDKGTAILVTSYKKSNVVTTSSIDAIPTQSSFKLELIGENCDKNETDVVADNYVISVVKVSGDVSLPARQKAYNSLTVTFGIGTPATGEKAIDWVSAEKSVRTDVEGASTYSVKGANLSALTIGNLTLSPAFNADVTAYTTTTSNATNTITATAADSKATVSIMLNGATTVANGGTATWTEGDNEVTIAVSNGTARKTYTVTVSKSII